MELTFTNCRRQCAGLPPYCYQADITNGTSDPTMQLDREAQVGCVTEQLKTTSLQVTKTMSTRTTTESVASVFTLVTTSFPTSSETSLTTILPTQSLVGTWGGTQPITRTTNSVGATGTYTTTVRGGPTVDSVRVENNPSDVTGRTVISTPPLVPTTDRVFDSAATKVTTPLTSSLVATFLTTTLVRTVTVGCTTGKT